MSQSQITRSGHTPQRRVAVAGGLVGLLVALGVGGWAANSYLKRQQNERREKLAAAALESEKTEREAPSKKGKTEVSPNKPAISTPADKTLPVGESGKTQAPAVVSKEPIAKPSKQEKTVPPSVEPRPSVEPGKTSEPAKTEPEPRTNEKTVTVEKPAKSSAEPGKAEPSKSEPSKAKPTNEPSKAEPSKTEPAKSEPSKAEPGKGRPATAEPTKETKESRKAEPGKTEPAKTEPAKTEPGKSAAVAPSKGRNKPDDKDPSSAETGRGSGRTGQDDGSQDDARRVAKDHGAQDVRRPARQSPARHRGSRIPPRALRLPSSSSASRWMRSSTSTGN